MPTMVRVLRCSPGGVAAIASSRVVPRVAPLPSPPSSRAVPQLAPLPSPASSRAVPQVVLLNVIVCGLEVCASAAFTYIPPLLLKSGLHEEQMSIVLGIGPLLGLFLVPVIGRASDRCGSAYGRRRPFIVALSATLIVSLCSLAYGDVVAGWVAGSRGGTVSVGLLIVGSVLLDFSSQACLTPCEALLSDACCDTDRADQCFFVYSFMVSVGGCIGYLVTAIDWADTAVGAFFGGQERAAFSILVVIFSATMVTSLTVAAETPLSAPTPADDDSGVALLEQIQKIQLGVDRPDDRPPPPPPRPPPGLGGALLTVMPRFVRSVLAIPLVLRRLAAANFCSWTAVMGFNLFYTDFVGQAVYGGDPNAAPDSARALAYDAGVRMGSWGLLLHCVTSAAYAAVIGRLVARVGPRVTYLAGMGSFTVAMAVMAASRNVVVVSAMAALTGVGYATLTTVPFLLVTQYHQRKQVSRRRASVNAVPPAHR